MVQRIKDLAIKYKYLLALILLSWLFRFPGYELPALMAGDSVKYTLPLEIIKTQNFEWMFQQINFSPLYRTCSFFLQSWNNGSVDIWIPIQKFLGILDSVFVYLLAKRLIKSPKLAFVVATIYSINSWKLILEDYIMAEGLYLPLITATLYSCVIMSDYSKEINKVNIRLIIYSLLTGSLLSLVALTKEVTLWKYCILAGILAFAIHELINNKKLILLTSFCIILVSSFLVDLPLMLYNKEHFNRFSIAAIPMQGNSIYSLNEKLIRNSKAEPQWLTKILVNMMNAERKRKGLNLNEEDRGSFTVPASRVTVAGRYGQFVNPVTQQRMSPEEFAKMGFKYYVDTSLGDPIGTLSRVKNSSKRIFFSPVKSFNKFVKNFGRNPVTYELKDTYLKIPDSFSDALSPKLEGLALLKTSLLREDKWFQDTNLSSYYKNAIPLFIDRSRDLAFLFQKTCLHIEWVNLMQDIPLSAISFILFVISLVIYLLRADFRKLDFNNYLILGHNCFFIFIPIFLTTGQSRYCLYVSATMLIFIISVLTSKTKANPA